MSRITLADRKALLGRLLEGQADPAEAARSLWGTGFDDPVPLVTLGRPHLRRLLGRFTSGEVDAAFVEAWANVIEGRDDIGVDAGYEDAIREIVFRLANPVLEGELDDASAAEMLGTLSQTG